MRDLSIIIVNYKTPQLLSACLQSVISQSYGLDFEIIVVDNNSGDNSRALITSSFPSVRWIQMTYNAGFARANNEGIRQSNGTCVLLLNSDTLVRDQAISNCYNSFVQSDYVACGVQLLNADGSPQISGNYFMKGGLNNLLPLPYTGAAVKWLGSLFRVKKPHVPDATAETEVDWINGAFLMVKKSTIDEAGLMDEDFFLYAEEAEWCYRLGKKGKLAIFGQYKVIHLQGETSNATFGSESRGYYNLYDKKGLQIMVSNFVRVRKQFGTGWYLLHLMIYVLTVPLFFLAVFAKAVVKFKIPRRELKLATQFSENISRLMLLSPSIIRNRPNFYKIL